MAIKEHEKRFGLIAVGKGFITLEQLVEAMKIQIEEDVSDSDHRLIGEILVGLGAMNVSQVMEVLSSLDNRNLGNDEKIIVRE